MTAPAERSYWARGRKREDQQDLLIDEARKTVTKPRVKVWNDYSDHTPFLYGIRHASLRIGRRRTSKKML